MLLLGKDTKCKYRYGASGNVLTKSNPLLAIGLCNPHGPQLKLLGSSCGDSAQIHPFAGTNLPDYNPTVRTWSQRELLTCAHFCCINHYS